MPRYVFHIDDGGHSHDRIAVELDDLRAARKEATVLAGEMLRDRPEGFWDAQTSRMTVEDEDGLILFVIEVSGAVATAVARRLQGA